MKALFFLNSLPRPLVALLSFSLTIACLWIIHHLLMPDLGHYSQAGANHAVPNFSVYEAAAVAVRLSYLVTHGAIQHHLRLIQSNQEHEHTDHILISIVQEYLGIAFFILLVFLVIAGSLSILVGYANYQNLRESNVNGGLKALRSPVE